MEVPIYIINGFLESGKHPLSRILFSDPEFSNEGTTLYFSAVNKVLRNIVMMNLRN